MIDHKRNLYDALSTKFDIGTYEEFESKIDNEEHRKRLYDAVSQTYDIGTYDEYNAKLGYQSTVTDTNYEPTLLESEEDAPEMSRRERRQARREERREARRNDDRPSWEESVAKGVGAGFTRTGKGLLDALHQLSAGMLYNDPETGEAKRLESYDTQMQDETNTFRNASVLASETAEELSHEADPTGGEKGFVDLIAEGEIGMALQKGLATGAESLPMTLSAYNPWTMALNAISMAGANYAEETLDNPEIDPWKRAVKAIGSAAIEQAVEKFADPVFKYIGGGKVAGELTEELAKELVEKGTKEATENIAKRIFRVLKNTAKDAAGEGVEEVVTSFGNDALGQALDWIDGDNDYGIRAQWEQMKSENPDADAWDFALAKGKEYMDSFIGGALSGGYMSGTANVFSEGAKFKYDRDARKILDESHAIGSSLDYGDMYDSDDTVREQMDAVAATFTNENGEASISGEFIGTLSSEDAFALSRRNDFTAEQRNALFGLARAKAIQEGLTTKLDERLESQINGNKVLIEAATENGSIITAMYGGKPVYVMGAWNKGDGTVTAPSGQNGPIMVVDAMTGEKSYARSEDIQFAESRTPTDYAAEVETMLRENDTRNRQVAQSTMSVRAKAKAVKPFAGKKILVDVGNGLTEVLVQQISPNGDVIIKGKKGDLGGQSIMTLSADVFYDSIYRDEDGNPVITEAPQETEAETPQEEAPIAEVTGDEDYRGQTIPILLNGVPTEVEVMSQDNPSDSIVYEYTDASGNRRTASSTIGAFNAAIQQAAEYVAPTPTAEETPPVETVPADSETQAPQEVPVTPENIDWDALFEQDPEAYFVELQNQFGEEALDILNEEVVAAQEELDSLSKKRGKTQNERLENRQKKVALQGRIDTLNGMIARLAPAEAPVVETPATETPAEVAPTEQPTATPETAPAVAETTPVTETPAVPESTEPAPVEQAPVAEAPAETVAEPEPTPVATESTPVAPNPVDNPAREAQKREKALAQQLQRYGISPEQKADMAFNAGKAVGDFFATREEYDAYAENATDLGDYNADFERGVEASFANRQQNVGNSPVNSVPLETEPNGENNGESAQNTEGPDPNTTGTGDNTGSAPASEGVASPKTPRSGKGKGGKSVASKYPARKGNATQKLLKDTFGFDSVSIPNSRKETLNSIYDFMMEMSKMLGISPKSIGQGGWLEVASLRSNSSASAQHDLRYRGADTITRASIKFKYDWLTGIAHEWWHSLDHALSYFETGKGIDEATIVSDSRFTGRKETLEAVREIINAIKKSGHPDRIRSFVRSRKDLNYCLSYTEMAARAFDEYINAKFAEGGITIEGVRHAQSQTQPTAEEMAVIAPAFDNLFKVLQEKEGKTPGTSVLYHIGEMMAEDSPAKRLATDAVLTALDDTSIDVVRATDKQTQQMLDIMDEVAEMQKGTAPETALPEDESSFKGTAISSADGAKIINNLDNLIIEYSQKPKNNVKTFIGDVARALEIDKRELPESSQKSRYATFEAKNGKIFTLRIANHNATVSFFDGNNESEGISVVISRTPNEGVANDGDAHIIEFFYKESDIVKSDGQPLVEILKSIKQSLYSGEYKDSTGLAKPQEVNAPELFKTPNGTVYGWTDGKKIYLTKVGINPNTPIHEYTHLWAKAMMQRNPKGWNSIKKLLKGTPVWNEVMSDPNYSSIHNDEDAVASEALSRISGTENAAKMEQMAQKMIDDAKGTARKLEARGLIQNMRDALNKFWKWVGTNLFGIEKFESVEQITDRVLFDLLNNTDLGTLSEGQVETQIVTDPKVIAELEAGPKRTGYRNVVMNEDGTFSSPMAYWLQGTKTRGGAKSRVETAKFVLGKWEEAEEHPELVDENGHVVLVKPNKDTVEVAYDPYIHNRLDPVNLQFKAAWNRPELVYVETEVPETDLESGYHAEGALLPVGVSPWSNGELMLSRYDKPVRVMSWEEVADAWVERLNGEGVHFDVVPPALRKPLVERGVDILPPHEKMGKACNEAYEAWKKESENSGFTSVDAEYLDAVERGDTETAQRMVLEAAKLAMPNTKVVDEDGNPKVVYHGSNAQFTEFDTARIGSTTGTADGRGFYFTTDRDYAEGFTTPDGQLFDVFLNIENPLSYDRKTITKAQLRKILKEADRVEFEREGEHYMLSNYANYNDVGIDGAINEAANLEYDYADNDVELVGSLIGGSGSFELIMDAVRKVTGKSGMIAPKDNGTTHYVVTNPSAIKSASAVTYDDNGNVIPLSQRFNPLNPDIRYRGSENNSLSSQSYEGTGDAYTDNDGRGMPQEGTGVPGEVPVSGPLSEGRRLARPENGKVSQNGVAGFNPISKREGESDGHRNNREAKFLSVVNNLTSDEQVNLYGFLKDYMSSPSGILRGRADDFINSIRQKGNNSFADFVEDFINDELKYREGVSASAAARHGIFVGVPYDASVLEQIFDAYNKDDYNERLFNRAIKLAKRFGVSIKFVTRNEDGSFFSAFGNYNPHDNTITLDANLLVKGNESELCQTIVHELIHSVVARAASIMTGRAVDKNNQFIDPQSLPKDVVDGINTLKEVYESIKDDGTFQDTYGKRDFEEMLSEITDPKFRGLLKAKKLWKKFLSGICKILGIADESSSETDALTEIESALDNILSAAERGELDSAYASYLGQLAEGYTLADLQKLGSGPVKTLLTQNVLFRTWIDKEAARASARDAFDEAAFVSFQAIADSISNATGFKGKAKAVKTGFIKTWNEYQMEHQDDQQYVIAGMEAIMQETGNTPIEDYENYLFFQNQMQSRSAEEIETYLDRYYKPIIAQINAIVTQILKSRGIKETNRAERMKVYAEVKQYLIAKHGLERNKLYQTTKTRNLNIGERTREINNAQKIYDDKVNQINLDTSLTDTERQLQLRDALDEYNATLEEINTRQVPDIRDYSGLTALFGLDAKEYREAERLAQELVDNFENEVSTDELWAKINAATNKTLRHSYECGLLSRSQYEQIRDMFQYYIPLRGFDETTAEDVYSYSRFEGNSFSPAVKKAKGRTSVANDPIAYIITMATSEIIQGNHNKEKQALYHFVANRPNSLLSIRDCWYVKDPVTGNYIETYPDIAGGETWEDFESKMETLAKSKSAIKRKKGLDVGYRFQKPANKNLHYIHVMINGVERAIVVNGNPRLAEGVNGIEDSKHKDLIKQVKRVNRVASQLFTNYNYKFGGKNFIRDFLFAQTMMLIDESPMYNLRFAANWFKYNPFTIGSLMRKYRKGTLDLSIEGHRLFKEFIENGGKTGYVFIDELEKQKDRINAAVERMSEVGNATTNGVTKARVLLEVISYVNECIELAARFGTYATSRQTKDKSGKERSIMRSIDDAKNVTTNFNRKGAQSGRGFIGGLAAFMGSWNFFYNAAVQGVQRVWSSARKRPVKSAIFWGGWIALGYLMPYIIDIFRGDDDEEEDIYWNLPEYERKNNICMPFGKGKVTATISLSPQIRECYAIGVTLSDATFNKSVDKDATALSMEVASLLAKAFLPANPLEGLSSGLTPAENLIMFGTPDIADPIVEAVINKDWTGAPIEYRTTYNEGAPHYTKVIGKDDWKKSVGEKLYKLGEDNLDSSMDWNLSAWEHVIKGGSGGLGVLFKDISNVVHWVISWEAPERLNDIPVARTFLSSNAMDDEKFVNNIYWDMDDIYQKKMQAISKVYGLTPTEVFEDKKGRGKANLVKVYEAKAYPFLEEYYKLNKEISKKYRDIRNMPEDTEEQKNRKAVQEQNLFNMKRVLVYKLLEYEIE